MWCRPRGGRPASGCLGVGRQDYPRTAGSRFAGRPYKNSSEIRPKPGRRAAVSSRTIEPAPPIMAARKENLVTGPSEAPGS